MDAVIDIRGVDLAFGISGKGHRFVFSVKTVGGFGSGNTGTFLLAKGKKELTTTGGKYQEKILLEKG